MTCELVAGREVVEPLHFALRLGADADQAGEALAAAVGAGRAQADHGQPDRAHRRRGFERDFELGALRIARLDQLAETAARFGTEPAMERSAARQAHRVGMIRDDVERAVPDDGVVADRPVESGDAGTEQREAHALGFTGRGDRIQAVGWLLLKRLTYQHPPSLTGFRSYGRIMRLRVLKNS